MRLAASLFCVSATLSGVVACGRFEFARIDSSSDGATDDGAADALPLGPFGAPQVVAAVSDPLTDDDPSITGDGLELYFASERGGAATGYADIYVSTRASTSSPWSAPAPVAELNSPDEDQSPGITADGLTIYFSSRRATAMIAGTSANTWFSTRSSRTTAWSAPELVLEVSTAMDEFEPQPDAANTHLVFYRQINASDRDIFIAARPSTTVSWGTPVPITEINAVGYERSPFLSADGRAIWFSSDRDSGMAGVSDLYVATRTMPTDSFGTPTPLTELDTAADDDDPCLTSDGRIIVFTSNVTGNYEIYEARR